MFYARFGQGEPVILLHGGLANSAYWGHQIPALAAGHEVIVIDTRGHGRSKLTGPPIGYDQLAGDVIAVMDALGVKQAAIVGWSDGAIIGLALAIRHPERVSRLFAFGANATLQGLIPGGAGTPIFRDYAARTAAEYRALSPAPGNYQKLAQAMDRIWRTQPNFTPAQLGSIRVPTVIADGADEEIIQPAHTRALAAAIPSATLVVFPDAGHFAMLQDPAAFNAALLAFLDR